MHLTVTNQVQKKTTQYVEFRSSEFKIYITVYFTKHSCEFRIVYCSSLNNKKLTTLTLNIDIKEGQFQTPKIIKEHGTTFEVKHNVNTTLDLTLKGRIYSWEHCLVFTTDKFVRLDEKKIDFKRKFYTITATSDLVDDGKIFVSYCDYLNSWWPPEAIAASIGVPPYSHSYSYNKINLSFWTTNQGPVDVALLWCNAIIYCSVDNPWGSTTQEIQQAWLNLYHQYGVKVLVSAFGATDFPTTQGADPIVTAEALAKFVLDNNLDGVDLDYEDNGAMETGTGVPWLISCTRKLRELLPKPYIISHAPQAPYFMGTSKYPDGGYLTVNSEVGNDIDYYNIQFYNQDSSKYDTYETLFNVSDGWATNTAVKQIATSVPKEKLVVGKGVKPEDYYNTGYVPVNDLANYLKQGAEEGYNAGFMGWQFSSDTTGSWSDTLAASFH